MSTELFDERERAELPWCERCGDPIKGDPVLVPEGPEGDRFALHATCATTVQKQLAQRFALGQRQAFIDSALRDAIEQTLEAFEVLAAELHRARGRDSSVASIRRFCAYHLADIEGAGAGWLGRGELVDDLRALLAEEKEEA